MVNCMLLALKTARCVFGNTPLERLMDFGELSTMVSLQKEQIHNNIIYLKISILFTKTPLYSHPNVFVTV